MTDSEVCYTHQLPVNIPDCNKDDLQIFLFQLLIETAMIHSVPEHEEDPKKRKQRE